MTDPYHFDWLAFWLLMVAATVVGYVWASSYTAVDAGGVEKKVSAWKVLAFIAVSFGLAMLGGLGFWYGWREG